MTGPASVRVVENRAARHWNACGQAAAATVLAHFRLGPFASGTIGDDAAAVDAMAATHPPDMPFGLGTTAWRLARALRDAGLGVRRLGSGPFGRHGERALDALAPVLAAGHPVPVLLDDGLLGGRPWSAHWAILLGADATHVRLGNARRERLPRAEFLRAWRCRQFPFTHHHVALVPEPRDA